LQTNDAEWSTFVYIKNANLLKHMNSKQLILKKGGSTTCKKGDRVMVSDSHVPVAKIDTACKSSISILIKKITKMLVLP
jgi:hypothetical protein